MDGGGGMSMQSRSHERRSSPPSLCAVLPKTNRVYEKEWAASRLSETGSDKTVTTRSWLTIPMALVMMSRHEVGKSGKAPTAFTAAECEMYDKNTG
jgi:hypothetical protein